MVAFPDFGLTLVTRGNEFAIDDSEEGLGRRTITIETSNSQARRDSTQPRLRKATSAGGFPRAATFERVLNTAFRRRRDESPSSRRSTQTQTTLPYFTFNPTIGRNSLFLGLTEEQREELGGVEYRAVKVLLIVLLIYFFSLLFLSWICLVPWIMRDSAHGDIVMSDGIGRPWWGIFTGASLFHDLGISFSHVAYVGYTLTPDSMISFQTAVFPLLLGSFLIIAGYSISFRADVETLASHVFCG